MTKETFPPRKTIIVTYACRFVAAFTSCIALLYTVWSKMFCHILKNIIILHCIRGTYNDKLFKNVFSSDYNVTFSLE